MKILATVAITLALSSGASAATLHVQATAVSPFRDPALYFDQVGEFSLGASTFTLGNYTGTAHYDYTGRLAYMDAIGTYDGLPSQIAFKDTYFNMYSPMYRYGFGPNVTLDGVALAFVPEPAAWLLLVVGFGSAGMALRRQNSRKGFRKVRTTGLPG